MYNIMIYSREKDVANMLLNEIKTTRNEYMRVVTYDNPYLAMTGSVVDGGYDIAIFHTNYIGEIKHARRLKFFENRTNIIYLTRDRELVEEMTNGEPFACLVGDEEFQNFDSVLDDAFSRAGMSKQLFFEYHRDRKSYMIDLNEILYFYSNHKTVNLMHRYLGDDYFYSKLDDVEPIILGKSNMFKRVNKSYLINVMYIQQATNNEIVMKDGITITLSEKYKTISNIRQ